MLKNYLVIAIRNLLRQKLYTLINVTGMAVGLAFCILAVVYILHEWSYDNFHERAGSIYLVEQETELGGQRYVSDRSSPPLGPMLAETFPQIESFVRLLPRGSSGSVWRGDVLRTESVLMADPWIFEVFSFDVVAGDPHTALADLGSVVLSREAAARYFGNVDPIGETLSIAGAGEFGSADGGAFEDFTVAGVVDVPTNTSIRFDVLVSLERTLNSGQATRWDWKIPITYVTVGDDVRPVEEGLAAILTDKMRERGG